MFDGLTPLGHPSRCSSAAEQLFRKQQATGSNPVIGSISPFGEILLHELNQVD